MHFRLVSMRRALVRASRSGFNSFKIRKPALAVSKFSMFFFIMLINDTLGWFPGSVSQ